MTDTLRDQLLTLGFKAPAPPERKSREGNDHRGSGKPVHGKPAHGRPAHDRRGPQGRGQPQPAGRPGGAGERTPRGPRGPGPSQPRSGEMDLGKAYALRAQHEKNQRIEEERQKQEEARQRREARARLEQLLQGKGLNDEAAEIARHFEYGGKIKRIYVTAPQLTALNAGELGVVQVNGRYLLVDASVVAEAETVFPQAVALRVDPDAPAGDDPYADPRYQVPDDLLW
ncbi:DUF2058 family protein [Pseudoxanthomonas daejeonensis]|uniref:DUF2058 domain-containing protein n=1 Tax=Pseudoxanthomonas daejeonensis TaxID=266062 RepID=UPI001F542462|nr:DUF2058 family protein [Pseudoxanthomonas daejeonensis]UNK57071.1 DUF2058 family protein [Pseudoxanthomonas daejeonensis]